MIARFSSKALLRSKNFPVILSPLRQLRIQHVHNEVIRLVHLDGGANTRAQVSRFASNVWLRLFALLTSGQSATWPRSKP